MNGSVHNNNNKDYPHTLFTPRFIRATWLGMPGGVYMMMMIRMIRGVPSSCVGTGVLSTHLNAVANTAG